MTPHEASKAGPYKHPSVANLNGLGQLSRSTSTNSVPSVRPAPQRSVSGHVETSQHFSGFSTMASPLATPGELAQEDPVTVLHLTNSSTSNARSSKRAVTGSPTVFGVGTLPTHSGGWSDSSGQTPSGASSVWNGRSGFASGSLDGDAINTAITSNVSTPGRVNTMGPGEFSRSPLSSGGGSGSGEGGSSAWPTVASGASPLGWNKDLSSGALDLSTSPTAAKQRLSPSDERRRQAIVRTVSPQRQSDASAELGAGQNIVARDRDISTSNNTAENSNGARTAATGGSARAMPKMPPVRSTTLDPSHHLPSQRRHSAEDDGADGPGDGNTIGQANLSDGLRQMSLVPARNDQAPPPPPPGGEHTPHSGQAVLSPSNNELSLQQMPNQPVPYQHQRPHHRQPQPPYQSTPQFGHAQRLSASYGSFSPVPDHVEGFPPQSMPYYSGIANRSPDAYGGISGLGHLMPSMGGGPAIDMSGYESYRTTPDPYAPPVPGRPVFMTPSGPGSQGSTPQSPSFGPSPMPMGAGPGGPMRPNDAVFYPGPGGPYGGPGGGMGSSGLMSPVGRHGMQPGTPQFGYATAAGSRGMPQSVSLGSIGADRSSMAMPQPGQGIYPPQSPLLQGQLSPAGLDHQYSPQGPPHQYNPGAYRRTSSNADGHGPSNMLSGRPPYPMGGGGARHGPPMPSQLNYSGAPMSSGWNGRFPDHRRVPTGPGGVMTPPTGFNGPMHPHGGAIGGCVRPLGGPVGHSAMYNGGRGGPAGMMVPPGTNSTRSPLLEEFRSRHAKNRKFELRDIFGSVVEFSGDQHGSRFIQEKLDTAADDEKAKVFEELIASARQLMTDVFGNYVIQKMLEHGNDTQRSSLAKEMEGHVLALSLGTYGCRVVQKAFDHTDEEQRIRLARELDGHILQCVKDQNANHVVQKVIEKVDPSKIDFVPQAFQGQVLALAAHCYSCRVLQRIFEHCHEEQSRPLLDELHAEAFRLMQDQYGNYVIQWVLHRGRSTDQAQVIAKIKGQVLPLSRHKFASNVIEEVIRSASPEDKVELIEETLTPRPIADAVAGAAPVVASLPPATPPSTAAMATTTDANANASQQRIAPAVIMMKDQFANYVLQRFLENARGEQKARLVLAIRPQLQSMKRFSNGYAKHLTAIERLLDEAEAGTEGHGGLGASASHPHVAPSSGAEAAAA